MLHYTVILPSEAQLPYQVEDKAFHGMLAGLVCGWQYEYTLNGQTVYDDVIYDERDADETAEAYHIHASDRFMALRGLVPTGRVVFRGYGVLHYWAEERDWYVERATDEQIAKAIQYAKEVTA